MIRGGYHTLTLGCKLNRFDSAEIEAELERRGYPRASDLPAADIVVVNTCTVTGKADAEARKLIRRVRRSNPGCRLLVTGCYAEIAPGDLSAAGGVDLVFGNGDKERLGAILDGIGLAPRRAPAPAGDRGCDGAPALRFGERGRAYLKVQEGCDLRCSYCVIPRARGPSRSIPASAVFDGLAGLLRSGYREVVLTGVNTGDWGRDAEPRASLQDLLAGLLERLGPNRIRLNSLEPLTVTDGIVRLMAADPRLAPHLQVPLQSGSERILRSMRRNYRPGEYLDRVERIRAAVPHAAIGADVIVGFPGETDADFEDTLRFVDRSPLDYLHVFAWSPRPGTPASSLPGRPRAAAIAERSARLRALSVARFREFRRRFVGREVDAVVLGSATAEGRSRAITGNFIETAIEGERPAPRQPVRLRVLAVEGDETLARVEGTPGWAVAPDRAP